MRRRTAISLAVLAFVLVPASAGAGTHAGPATPELALTATPSRVALVGSGSAAIRVTNPSARAIRIDVGRAGFALDLRGRPRVRGVTGSRAAVSWLSVRPAQFVLAPRASRAVTVAARLPRRVEPGDHDALVLLTTRPQGVRRVAVRMRIGVVVVVRAPGLVVRRVALGPLRVRRDRGRTVLQLRLVNRGNVTEHLPRGRIRIAIVRGESVTMFGAEARELRPRTSGIVELIYRGRMRGWVTARAEIAVDRGRPVVARTFRVKV